MYTLASDVTSVFSILTIIAQIASVLIVLAVAFRKSWGAYIVTFVSQRVISISLIVALLATVGSLLYSDVIGYEPCKLCWFQRIFMYPQVVILAIAFFRKTTTAVVYSLALSVMGGLIAFYHYLLQRGVVDSAPCSAVGYGANCSEVFVMSYGYITIPLMAFSAFALISAVLFAYSVKIRS